MPTALSGEELDALIAHFDALVTKSLRRAIRAGTTEALTAASNLEQFHLPGEHNQETHGHGHGGEPRSSPFSPLIEPHDVKTHDQLQEVANGRQLPPDDNKWEHFYHSTRSSSEIDSIAESGVQAPQSGKNVFLSKDEVRDRGGGFVIVRVPRGSAIEGSDRVESGLTYREFTVKNVPPENVVRGIRSVTDSSGFKINEDELAKYALENQGSSSVADLPSEYRGWFNVKSMTAAGVPGPEQVDAEGEPHTGSMIALVPKDPESWTLKGGESADSLHVTLAYLGDFALIPDHIIEALDRQLSALADRWHPVDGKVFGVSIWNAHLDTPSLNASVGSDSPFADGVEFMHDFIWRLLYNDVDEDLEWEPPPQHSPWVAHMCLAYGDANTLTGMLDEALKLEGPITFDRIRLGLGDKSVDYVFKGQ